MFHLIKRVGAFALTCALLFQFSQEPVFANESIDPGQINFRRDIKDTQDEYIDPYTGTVRLKYLDYSLPGNAGLDLNIYRVYSTAGATNLTPPSPSQGEGDNATKWRVGPLGFGWDIHFGRMSKNSRVITVELGDGTIAKLVQQERWGDTWISSEFWKLVRVGQTYTLYLPNGTQIVFGHYTGGDYDELLGYRYATEIKKNGQVSHL